VDVTQSMKNKWKNKKKKEWKTENKKKWKKPWMK
jgi:hypothetical protein